MEIQRILSLGMKPKNFVFLHLNHHAQLISRDDPH